MLLAFALCGFAALSARAQDENQVEVFGGYSYLHFHNNPSTNLNGWEIAGQYRFRDWLGGVAVLTAIMGLSAADPAHPRTPIYSVRKFLCQVGSRLLVTCSSAERT